MTEKGCEKANDRWAGEEERLGAEGQGWRLAPGAGLRAEVVGMKDRGTGEALWTRMDDIAVSQDHVKDIVKVILAD